MKQRKALQNISSDEPKNMEKELQVFLTAFDDKEEKQKRLQFQFEKLLEKERFPRGVKFTSEQIPFADNREDVQDVTVLDADIGINERDLTTNVHANINPQTIIWDEEGVECLHVHEHLEETPTGVSCTYYTAPTIASAETKITTLKSKDAKKRNRKKVFSSWKNLREQKDEEL